MKRRIVAGTLVAALVAVVTFGSLVGPDWWSYQQFLQAIDRRADVYEANGGAWPQLQDSCALCHGDNGAARNSQYASLAGQPAAYIDAQLRAFAAGRRTNAYMNPYAASLSDDRIRALAEFYARQPPIRNEIATLDPAVARRGREVVDTSTCTTCHGGRLMGGAQGPRLAGQGAIYLADQLRAYRQGERQDPTQAMNGLAALLSDEQIAAAAAYLASLDPSAISLGERITTGSSTGTSADEPSVLSNQQEEPGK